MAGPDVTARVRAAWAEVLDEPADDQRSFFSVGGHSLAAARLIARLREDLRVDVPMSAILRDDPTLPQLVAVVSERLADPPVSPPAAAAPPPASSSVAPLAPTLRRIWTWHRLHPDSPAYNVVRVLRVDGRVQPAPLRAALADLAARHEALRCAVEEPRPGEPEVVVADRVTVPLSVEVLRQPAAVDEALYKIADRPFPLAKAPLWRVGAVVEPAANRTWLVLVMHHLISDMRSTNIVLDDLAVAYQARAARTAPRFAEPAPSFLAHLAYEAQVPGTPRWEDHLDWWSRRLADAGPATPLPLSRPLGEKVFAGETRSAGLPADESDALDHRLREQGLTPAVFFLTAAGAVLAGWTGQQRAEVLGLPSVRLSRPEDERLVGFLLDTLPLPVATGRDQSFRDAYQAVRDAFADAADHALPVFDDLVDRLRLPRADAGRTPLIRLWFNDLTRVTPPPNLGDLAVAEYDLPPAWALFDLGLYVRRGPDGYRLHLVTPAGLFDPPDIEAFLAQILHTALRAGTDTTRPLGDLLAPPPAAGPADAAPAVSSTVDLVEQHSRSRPDAPALADREGVLDYASLHRQVDELARTLRDTAGPGAVVALPARRDRQHLIRLLACRRAGLTAVLVDASWPQRRRDRALEIARVTHAFPRSSDGPLAQVTSGPGPENGGHILFTSGTTGDPLAVEVSGAVADSALADLADRLAVTPDDRVSLLSGPAHDPVLRDLGLALRSGGTVCVPPPEAVENPGRLAAWLRQERITLVNATPAMLALALGADPQPLPDLRAVVCGGSPLSVATVELIRSRAPQALVVNGYGCTETPQLVAAYELAPEHPLPAAAQLPIGSPLPGRRVEVRDPAGRRCAPGHLGEIWVAAPHIAEGYRGTAARDRFTADPDGLRWLRTGDLARSDAAGRLHLAGRADRQVLVNGHRVTLDEIESVARGCPGVTDAVAQLAGDETRQSLRVWVQRAPGATVTDEAVRARLVEVLPAAAVPARVQVVDRLAVSANLKPMPPAEPPAPAAHRTERRLQELAESMLGRPVDPATNFFDAGFTSISLLQMCAELTDMLGRPVEPLHIFERPNLESLSLFLFGPRESREPARAPTIDEDRSVRMARMRAARRQARTRIQETLTSEGRP